MDSDEILQLVEESVRLSMTLSLLEKERQMVLIVGRKLHFVKLYDGIIHALMKGITKENSCIRAQLMKLGVRVNRVSHDGETMLYKVSSRGVVHELYLSCSNLKAQIKARIDEQITSLLQ